MSDKKKKKKENVKYIDDGRTIADMSGLRRGGFKTDDKNFVRPPSTAKDKWNTYWSAVRSMLIPMFITLGVITAIFLVAFLAFGGIPYYFGE